MNSWAKKILAGITTAAGAYAARKLGPEAGLLVSGAIGLLTSYVAHRFHLTPSPVSTEDVGSP